MKILLIVFCAAFAAIAGRLITREEARRQREINQMLESIRTETELDEETNG